MKKNNPFDGNEKVLFGLLAFGLFVAFGRNGKKIPWPVDKSQTRVGQSIMQNRGNGQPHSGVDLFTKEGTIVKAVVDGSVIRVTDGRTADPSSSLGRAGLFIDVKGADNLVYRFLHLGSSSVKPGEKVVAGQAIGTVAKTGTSGLGSAPSHIHFEIRESDWNKDSYGPAIDPLSRLA